MRKYLFIFAFLLPILGIAQRYDSKWLLGYNSLSPNISDITEMTFTENTMNMNFKYLNPRFGATNTAMYDLGGNMLFCTNGVKIWNKNLDVMMNSNGLNPSPYTNSQSDGLYISQGIIAIPSPKQDNKYYLFHETLKWTSNFADRPLEFYYSIIDMNENNGFGAVISKNNIIINDTLDFGQITACKHANGRDWWVLVPRFSGEGYYRLLLSVGGVQNLGLQTTGNYAPPACASQAVFSPDGTKYVRYDQGDWTDTLGFVNIFDFDRCTGLLSNRQIITIPHLANWWGAAGVAISPNSKVVYVNDSYHMYQFDLTVTDIASTQYLVATYDGFQSPFGSTFFQGQLAPNGKIYWNCTNGETVLHIINYPDSLGSACDFQQHGVQLLAYNAYSLPNHPNYYLGAMAGSACDTLTSISNLIEIANIYAYPNPTQDKLYIGMNHIPQGAELLVINSLGQEVYRKTIVDTTKETEISLVGFPAGIYYLQVRTEGKVFSQKMVKE